MNLLDDYDARREVYLNALKPAMKDYLDTEDINGKKLSEVAQIVSSLNTSECEGYLNGLKQMLNNHLSKTNNDGTKLLTDGAINEYYRNLTDAIDGFTKPHSIESDVEYKSSTKVQIGYTDADKVFVGEFEIDRNGSNNYAVKYLGESNEKVSVTCSPVTIDVSAGKGSFICTEKDIESGHEETITITFDLWDPATISQNNKPQAETEYNKSQYTDEDWQNFTKNIIQSIYQFATSQFNLEGFYQAFKTNSNITTGDKAAVETARIDYQEAAEALAKFTFGSPSAVSAEDYDNLVNIDWIIESEQATTDKFTKILDLNTLENIFDTYGEPVYAWVDKFNPNSNGEKRAEWLTNLFNRMNQGYKVLEDGLASSAEWIKYALESGLLVMEQVDSEKKWNTFTYTNCSDITEQTDNLSITKAEAEYKKAMNSIENKDKRYDMELKKIDTEHSALQTEYDSVKSVMDKNIERTFKMYS